MTILKVVAALVYLAGMVIVGALLTLYLLWT